MLLQGLPFYFFNSSSVESHGTVPESDEYEKIQIMHPLNQPNTGKALILDTFSVLVLTISISKRIFCFLLASLKKSLEQREFCRKGIHGKSLLMFDPFVLDDM